MILEFGQVIFGILLLLFVPGFFLTLLFFDELNFLEKISLGIVLSLLIDVALGIFFGYNEFMKKLTGGITSRNIWIGLISISLILIIAYTVKVERDYLNFKKTETFITKSNKL